MLDKFWDSIGSNLAEEWQKYIFSPAFLFWAGGLGIFFLTYGWKSTWSWLNGLKLEEHIALLLLILLVIVLSSLLMKILRFDILRLLEGYWPWPISSLGDWLALKKDEKRSNKEMEWNELKGCEANLTRGQTRKLAKLDAYLHYIPSDRNEVQPTTLGNILREGETIPYHKYGLDAIVCWPRLWLLLPENVRGEISSTRSALMEKVELWSWGLLFLIWVIWSPWAILFCVVWMLMARHWTNRAGMSYTDLIESTFDTYRWLLYEAAHWELPANSDVEKESGVQLNEFFWRGQVKTEIVYKKPEKDKS